ncbi:MAG TPA: hypothetical protein VNR41_14530 [Xanthobacteraceae bacterium]|jgi:hypothetical protein|nr:hypothetical protein [Xanthobacteraceae bacterium]
MAGTAGRQRRDLPASMSEEQSRTLKDLARNGREPEAYHPHLSAEGAEMRIRILRAKLAKDKSGKQHKPT